MSKIQLSRVESPLRPLLESLHQRFDAKPEHKLTAPYRIADLSLKNTTSNLVIVELPESRSAVGEF